MGNAVGGGGEIEEEEEEEEAGGVGGIGIGARFQPNHHPDHQVPGHGGEEGPRGSGGSSSSQVQEINSKILKRLRGGVRYNLKVLVRGARGTGKSSLVARLQGRPFPEEHRATPGIQNATINWISKDGEEAVKVDVWDVVDRCPGGSGFRGNADFSAGAPIITSTSTPRSGNGQAPIDASMVDVYRDANFVIFMVDPREPSSFEYVEESLESLPPSLPILIIVNFRDSVGNEEAEKALRRSRGILGARRGALSTKEHQNESHDCEGTKAGSLAEPRPATAAFTASPDRTFHASMLNCFGLKLLYSHLNVPFLILKKETLMKQLEITEIHLQAAIEESDDLMEESSFEKFSSAFPLRSSLPRSSISRQAPDQNVSNASSPRGTSKRSSRTIMVTGGEGGERVDDDIGRSAPRTPLNEEKNKERKAGHSRKKSSTSKKHRKSKKEERHEISIAEPQGSSQVVEGGAEERKSRGSRGQQSRSELPGGQKVSSDADGEEEDDILGPPHVAHSSDSSEEDMPVFSRLRRVTQANNRPQVISAVTESRAPLRDQLSDDAQPQLAEVAKIDEEGDVNGDDEDQGNESKSGDDEDQGNESKGCDPSLREIKGPQVSEAGISHSELAENQDALGCAGDSAGEKGEQQNAMKDSTADLDETSAKSESEMTESDISRSEEVAKNQKPLLGGGVDISVAIEEQNSTLAADEARTPGLELMEGDLEVEMENQPNQNPPAAAMEDDKADEGGSSAAPSETSERLETMVDNGYATGGTAEEQQDPTTNDTNEPLFADDTTESDGTEEEQRQKRPWKQNTHLPGRTGPGDEDLNDVILGFQPGEKIDDAFFGESDDDSDQDRVHHYPEVHGTDEDSLSEKSFVKESPPHSFSPVQHEKPSENQGKGSVQRGDEVSSAARSAILEALRLAEDMAQEPDVKIVDQKDTRKEDKKKKKKKHKKKESTP